MVMSRRTFFAGAAGTIAAASVSRVALAAIPEAVQASGPETAAPLLPSTGRPYNPVVTLNGWTLPWRMRDGVKEFHLVAEPVTREMCPGFNAKLWGYNGQSPGPTIEVVEGDLVRLFVTNRLPERTSVHWHGQRLPNGMDGVTGLTQPGIEPGQTFVYEFVARRPGTFMYHPHADEMLQMAMGMMGMWVTHPKARHPQISEVQRDFCFLLNSYDIEPGSAVPKPSTMTDFNLWTWNSRVFPGIAPLPVRRGDRVRIRVGNLSMTNHPIHLHGHEFEVTGTDGGPVPKSARWPEVTTDIAVGQMRQIEFIADEEGDWSLHCHKSHHTMNAMGHGIDNLLGVKQDDLAPKIARLIPGYMAMGETGMAEMEGMTMAGPANTAPMMGGDGPYGSLGMGGMFSVVKVRRDQKPGDYSDPGWWAERAPKGSVAHAVEAPSNAPSNAERREPMNGKRREPLEAAPLEVEVRKPGGHDHH